MLLIEGNNIHLTRGDSAALSLEVTDQEGQPYTPKVGDEFIFSVKNNDLVVPYELTKKFNSELDLYITSEESSNFNFGVYLFDIKLVNNGVVDTFIIGNLIIEEGTYNE